MMVQQLKEDQAGKSEEELSECFRIFDKYEPQTQLAHYKWSYCAIVLSIKRENYHEIFRLEKLHH